MTNSQKKYPNIRIQN